MRALDLWRTLLRELSVLNDKMHVLLIGHAQIKSFQDPELPTAYDRYQLKINDKAAALVREAADAVLFARFQILSPYFDFEPFTYTRAELDHLYSTVQSSSIRLSIPVPQLLALIASSARPD